MENFYKWSKITNEIYNRYKSIGIEDNIRFSARYSILCKKKNISKKINTIEKFDVECSVCKYSYSYSHDDDYKEKCKKYFNEYLDKCILEIDEECKEELKDCGYIGFTYDKNYTFEFWLENSCNGHPMVETQAKILQIMDYYTLLIDNIIYIK